MASANDGRAEAVAVLKTSNTLSAPTKAVLSEALIAGVIEAERQGQGFVEWAWESLGGEAGAGGLGPGQMYEPAYKDVSAALAPDLQRFLDALNAALAARGEAAVSLSESWAANVKDTRIANFFILGYLAICVERSQKPGRTAGDALRYGIANFHGARATVTDIQRKVDPAKFNQNQPIAWANVERYIVTQGSSKEKELLHYISVVLAGGVTR